MRYRYYSLHRPVDIGTFPGSPEKIINYPEGRKEITAADGQTIRAWGELHYTEPLTEEETQRYELRGEYEHLPYRHVGYWLRDKAKEIIKLGSRFFVLDGWNGTVYMHCFEALTATKMAEPNVEYILTPIYYYETAAGVAMMDAMADLEEDSPEWKEKAEKLNEVISYSVSRN